MTATNSRERGERAETQDGYRVRRSDTTIDDFKRSKLNPFGKDALDRKNWKYRWFVDDNMGRIQNAYNNYWEFVSPKDIKDYDSSLFKSEGSDDRIRQQMGPGIFGYLMKKRTEYVIEDYEGRVARNRKENGSDSLLQVRGGARQLRQY